MWAPCGCLEEHLERVLSSSNSADAGWVLYEEMRGGSHEQIQVKSLILAQIERWRHALHMQVERQHGGNPGGEWRTGE